MHKFFVDAGNILDDKIYIDDKEDVKHITRVLRSKIGDEIVISDCDKWEYICRINNISEYDVTLIILDKQSFSKEPSLKVTLFQGIPKQGKMEVIVQKNVELGIAEIVPVFMKRTIIVENSKFSKKIERWQKVASEAVKQCKRGLIPEVKDAVKFEKMIKLIKNYDLVIFPYENEEKINIKDYLRNINKKVRNVALIVGPEGGFSEEEAEAMVNENITPISLGKTILRTETAGMAALSMIMYELEL